MVKTLCATKNYLGIAILRLFIGVMFMSHGSQKLFGAFGGGGIQEFAKALESMQVPYPLLSAYLAGCSEFFGGLALVIGFLVRPATIPLLAVMGVAICKVHWSAGFFLQGGGFEYPFVISGGLLALLIHGAGALSIDGLLAGKKIGAGP